MGSNDNISNRWLAAGVTSILALGLLGVGGCSASDDDASADTIFDGSPATGAPASTVTPDPGAPMVVAGADAGIGGGTPVGEVGLSPARSSAAALAIEASVSVEVADVREAVLALPEVVRQGGGEIYDTEIAIGDPATAVATVVIKVRPEDLEAMIAGLGDLGRLTGRTQSAEDVTDQIADVEARTLTAQASVDRVRQLLEQAADLDDIVRIESELTIRETALEQLLASQRNLDDRVRLSTLTVHITPAPVDAPTVAAVIETHETGIGDALATGWQAFADTAHGIAVAVAYAAPFLLVAALSGLVAFFLRRRIRPAHARFATASAQTGGPDPDRASDVGG